MIEDTVAYLVRCGRKVIVDCEHFFDGFCANRGYALDVVRTAAEAGAEIVVLCDTNGGMLPAQVEDVVSVVCCIGVDLGIHCHNDSGCAIANSLAAVGAGVMHVQCTINGYGERTGNADLITLISNLQLKYGWPLLDDTQLAELTHVSHAVADIANQAHMPRQPYVGHSAFAHKAGMHASAIKVSEDFYQHIRPEAVGNDMRMLVSALSGRSSIHLKAVQLGLQLDDSESAVAVSSAIKQKESQGYSYEAADASFELLLRQITGDFDSPFEVLNWKIASGGASDLSAAEQATEATVELVAKGTRQLEAGRGNGPVDALEEALQKALSPVYPKVSSYDLIDYRVRILDEGRGSDATVRVLIDTTNGEHDWTTVGVGTNVIEASWEALLESFMFGLIKGY